MRLRDTRQVMPIEEKQADICAAMFYHIGRVRRLRGRELARVGC